MYNLYGITYTVKFIRFSDCIEQPYRFRKYINAKFDIAIKMSGLEIFYIAQFPATICITNRSMCAYRNAKMFTPTSARHFNVVLIGVENIFFGLAASSVESSSYRFGMEVLTWRISRSVNVATMNTEFLCFCIVILAPRTISNVEETIPKMIYKLSRMTTIIFAKLTGPLLDTMSQHRPRTLNSVGSVTKFINQKFLWKFCKT